MLLTSSFSAQAAMNGTGKHKAPSHGPAIEKVNIGKPRSQNITERRTTSYDIGWEESGKASWYGRWHAGRLTCNGERYDSKQLTVAHRFLPVGTILLVTNTNNGKQVVVRVNDRGPYYRQRILDASEAAADRLGFKDNGVTMVTIKIIKLPSNEIQTANRS